MAYRGTSIGPAPSSHRRTQSDYPLDLRFRKVLLVDSSIDQQRSQQSLALTAIADILHKRTSMNKTTWPHWDVYFECFFPLKFGHPLWHPFGQEGAVLLGDVGWFQRGKFCPLFNSMRDEDHAVHFVRGVPQGFQPITKNGLFIERNDGVLWGPLVEEGVSLGAIDLPYKRRDTTW